MKNHNYLPLFLITLVIGLAAVSCEKVIDINIPESERKIVINALLNPDSPVAVNISRSLSVLEENEFVFIEDASVKLLENEQEVGQLSYGNYGNYYLSDFKPKAGMEYTLSVDANGLRSVSASTQLPNPIEIGVVDTSSAIDEWGNEELRLSFNIPDPAGEKNKYAIAVFATHRVFDWEKLVYLDSVSTYPVYFNFLQDASGGPQSLIMEDNSTVYFGNKIYISDALFNGVNFRVDLNMGKYSFFGADTVWLDVAVEHVAEPYYLYALSSSKYDRSNGNPFAEPVSVYTNVENGLGIFSGYATSSRRLQLVFAIDW